jgi:hypothetical protein
MLIGQMTISQKPKMSSFTFSITAQQLNSCIVAFFSIWINVLYLLLLSFQKLDYDRFFNKAALQAIDAATI